MKSLLIALNILGIAACFALVLVIRYAPLWTATEQKGAVAIWLWTPYLSAGDTAQFDVDVVGGKRSGINSIELVSEGSKQSFRGEGANWGGLIVSKSGDVGHASHDLSLKVPDTLKEGDTWLVQLHVDYTLAVSGGGGFHNESDSESFSLQIPIRSNSSSILHRLWSAAWPTAIFGVFVFLFAWFWHPLAGLMKKEPADPSEKNLYGGLATLAIAGLIVWAFSGWAFFAIPWTAATGFSSEWFQFGMAALWLFAPPLIGRKIAGEPPRAPYVGTLSRIDMDYERPYRKAPSPPQTAPSLQALGAALEKNLKLRCTLKGNRLIAGRSRFDQQLILEVSNPQKIEPSHIRLETPESLLAIQACEVFLPLLGPVNLNLAYVPVSIDGSISAEAIHADWQKRYAERMWEEINALQKELEQRLKNRDL